MMMLLPWRVKRIDIIKELEKSVLHIGTYLECRDSSHLEEAFSIMKMAYVLGDDHVKEQFLWVIEKYELLLSEDDLYDSFFLTVVQVINYCLVYIGNSK
ncbi:hypothetical protein [Bacillus subtilis]|uniref:Uncharacterized protein n=1 Tax=Bacillus subtilis TaxID=1423 RepID=A0A8I2B8W8_BACIU|nr:hypothetical protein [Bacillus subtilis]MBO3794235.1 hypothetical protein [Bacillus subtilis]